MISIYDTRKYLETHPECNVFVGKDKNIVDKKSGRIITTLEDMTQRLRVANHCDFEVVFSCHGTLEVIYRCRQCGTVVFSGDDERYDPNLRCPTCDISYADKCSYWSAKDINSDKEKQKMISAYEQATKDQIEANKRYYERGQKYDWQLGSCRIKLPKKKAILFELECNNFYREKLKGLRLEVSWIVDRVHKKHCWIPLSLYAWKLKILSWKNNK